MNVTASSLTPNWTDNPNPFETNATNLTVPAGAIKAWCKGASFAAQVTATGADAPQWEVGLIQILGTHAMEAKFKEDTTVKKILWRQAQLPCYDSGAANHIPWYNINTGSRADLVNGAPVNVTCSDYPTMMTYLRLGDNPEPATAATHSRREAELFYIKKVLRFEVYLVARKRGVPNWRSAANSKVLRAVTWETEIVAEREVPTNEDEAHFWGFATTTHTRTNGDVSVPARTADVLLPRTAVGMANGNIRATLV